jgi:trehalose-phosphatase
MKMHLLTPPETQIIRMTPTYESNTPALFKCWEEISTRVRAAKEIQIFLDFDGTLVPYTPRPDQVKLEVSTEAALRNLVTHDHVHVSIVSGRRRSVLTHYLKLPGLKFMGLYGWETSARVSIPARRVREIAALRKILRDLPLEAPGIAIENKGISVAVHFRGASDAAQTYARAYVRGALAGFRADLHVIQSHSAWDIVPCEVRGKGIALQKALTRIRKPFLPIYVGDDLTDEPAFTVARDGITVRVGATDVTRAHYRLFDSDEVRDFLVRLEAELE